MFGRKDAKIKELELKLRQKEDEHAVEWTRQAQYITKLEKTELKLMGQIREMDQLVHQMSQQPSWELMRPYFNSLQDKQERRQRAESDRIATLLIPEMQKAYR